MSRQNDANDEHREYRNRLELFPQTIKAPILENVSTQNESSSEYILAQRAASEAISTGRQTLETTMRQSEQLHHCSDMMDQQEYILQKSARLVRGMTWSGWIANKFSKDVQVPVSAVRIGKEKVQDSEIRDEILNERYSLAEIPPKLYTAVSSFKNYHCNVLLIRQCQNKDQLDSYIEVCTQLRQSTQNVLSRLDQPYYLDELEKNLLMNIQNDMKRTQDLEYKFINQSQEKFTKKYMHMQHQINQNLLSSPSSSTNNSNVGSIPHRNYTTMTGAIQSTDDSTFKSKLQHQDEHISVLSSNLEELQYIGNSIGSSLQEHSEILDLLTEKGDSAVEDTKRIVRKADRLSRRSMWKSVKTEFSCWVIIQHIQSHKYLTVDVDTNKVIINDFVADASVFGVWKRHEQVIGLVNRATQKWLGQTLMGNVGCSASSFGRREEWELDDYIMDKTKILCACANWGNGGWLEVSENGESISIGNYGSEAKKQAALWSVVVER